MQGGIHPDYTGETYLGDLPRREGGGARTCTSTPSRRSRCRRAPRRSVCRSPISWRSCKAAGLGTLPGTAAEILDDEVRAVICPDKVTTAQWLDVVRAAHGLGLRTTATIMFGHVEHPLHWARHLLRAARPAGETGGFTEFVPLPFVHMEAPMYLKGRARRGPTFREAVLMHAVARLALHPLIPNIQTSWVKMGPAGVAACLNAGANDLGGTLMNESISRAAGTAARPGNAARSDGALIRSLGRVPAQRTRSTAPVPEERRAASFDARGTRADRAHPATQAADAGSPRSDSLRSLGAADRNHSSRKARVRVRGDGGMRRNAARSAGWSISMPMPGGGRSSARCRSAARRPDAGNSCRRRSAAAPHRAASRGRHWSRDRRAPARW